jgi:hypothetical protein
MGGPFLPAQAVLARLGTTVTRFCAENGVPRMTFYAGASRGERWAVELLRANLGNDVADMLAIPKTFRGGETSPTSEAETSDAGTPLAPAKTSPRPSRKSLDPRRQDRSESSGPDVAIASPRENKRVVRDRTRVSNPLPLDGVR